MSYYQNAALLNNVPELRFVAIARTGEPEDRLYPIVPDLIAGLTDPLTAQEQYVGTYVPEMPPRIIFQGTTDEAQDFFQQTEFAETPNANISIYTDGLPIIPPQRGEGGEMLTGTSHSPEEIVTSADGDPVLFSRYYKANVEKVAAIVRNGRLQARTYAGAAGDCRAGWRQHQLSGDQ